MIGSKLTQSIAREAPLLRLWETFQKVFDPSRVTIIPFTTVIPLFVAQIYTDTFAQENFSQKVFGVAEIMHSVFTTIIQVQ